MQYRYLGDMRVSAVSQGGMSHTYVVNTPKCGSVHGMCNKVAVVSQLALWAVSLLSHGGLQLLGYGSKTEPGKALKAGLKLFHPGGHLVAHPVGEQETMEYSTNARWALPLR